jgi:hypothetical protein
VAIAKKGKGSSKSATISYNLANNLRIRDMDKVKVASLETGAEATEERSGDMLLLTKQPETAFSVTYSPVEDSLNSLVASEGGDDIEDEELTSRFVTPYLDTENVSRSVVAKEGHVVSMRDENGKQLDFIVTHVDEGEERDEEGKIEVICCKLNVWEEVNTNQVNTFYFMVPPFQLGRKVNLNFPHNLMTLPPFLSALLRLWSHCSHDRHHNRHNYWWCNAQS